MDFDVEYDSMSGFESAAAEEFWIFDSEEKCMVTRYSLAKRMYKGSNLAMVSEIMIEYINKKQLGQATENMYEAVLDYFYKAQKLETSINGMGFMELIISDLKHISKR